MTTSGGTNQTAARSRPTRSDTGGKKSPRTACSPSRTNERSQGTSSGDTTKGVGKSTDSSRSDREETANHHDAAPPVRTASSTNSCPTNATDSSRATDTSTP